MPKLLELRVPDLGGFEDVPIIEVLVVSGDSVDLDAPLVTLESDKATMEVPASAAGIIREVTVKIGDRVSPGSVLANVEVADDAGASPAPAVIGSGPESTAIGAPDNGAQQHAEPVAPSKSTQELTVPDLGGFDHVPVISVFVKAGDTIAKDAALVELESDKATMEVPALVGGVIADVRVNVGDKVSPGTVLATIETAAESSGAAASAPPSNGATSVPSDSAAVPSTTAPAASNTAQSEPSTSADAGRSPTDVLDSGPSVTQPAPHSQNGSSNGTSHGVAGGPFHASPAIRRFARELGVTVGSVSGTGPNGRITRDDVQQYIKRALSNPGPAAPAAASPSTDGTLTFLPWPKLDFERFGPVERRPRSRIAKLSGQNLARNWVMIPHVTQYEDADVTELEVFRKTVNAEQHDVKVTMLALLMKALVATLRAYPDFNSSLDGDELIIKQYYHLGFAADTPNGLVVPVIRDVDKKGILQIAADTSALAKKARDGKLAPADMSGSGFTISSLGGIGGTSFTPIINAPEVAILGVSRTITKPVWDGATFAPRLILPLSLSYDHRVIDGAAAARFCAYLAGVMADIRKVLL